MSRHTDEEIERTRAAVIEAREQALQAKADALKDTLDSRNASGSLERDASLETMGRLTDFIRVAEGWEEGVARALEQFAGAMVVPGREQMLHALKKAKAAAAAAARAATAPTIYFQLSPAAKSIQQPMMP